MANYAKQFLEELKAAIEAHLNSLTTNKDHVETLMKAFKMPDDPKPNDVDRVIGEHSENLQYQMVEMLSNKSTQQDSTARLDQAKLFANANVFIPPLMTNERSDFIENHFKALERRALDAGVEQSEIDPLKMSILKSQNDFGVFQTAMDNLEGLVNSKQAVINPDINASIVPVPSAPPGPEPMKNDQYVAPTLDAKAATAKDKLIALISSGTIKDSAQNKKLYELAAKLDSGVANLSADEAKQLTSAIIQAKDNLGNLPETNKAISEAVSALAQLQMAMNKQYPQVEMAVIEFKSPDGNIMTPDAFKELMEKAGIEGKVKFDKMEGNVARFAEESKDVRYEIKVTADTKNPNNFVIEGTDLQKVADLARGIQAVDMSIPLTLKMGNDPEKAFELLKLLTKAKEIGDEVKVNVTPEQRATFKEAFANDPRKLDSLKGILAIQDRLAAQSAEHEPSRGPGAR